MAIPRKKIDQLSLRRATDALKKLFEQSFHHFLAKETCALICNEQCEPMKKNFQLALALVTIAVIGGAASQSLHAQAGPPVYVIEEIDVSNLDSYLREYAVKSLALVNASGGHRLVIGNGKITPIEGEPPKSRVVVLQWESMEKMQAWLNSPENKELRKIGDKYAKFRIFAVEGLPR